MAGAFYGRTGIDFRNTVPEGVEKLKGKVRRDCINAVNLVADRIVSRAQSLCNVRTGLMRDNIEAHVIEKPGVIEARVGVDLSVVPYAHHQEFGPHGKPYLRPALDETRPEAHEIFQSVIDGTMAEDASTFVRFNRGKP